MENRRRIASLLLFIAVPLAVGLASGAVTAEGVAEWYPSLRRPEFTPPGWLFGPVWTLLYLSMGVAAWLVWRGGLDAPDARRGLAWFGVQLALNGLWSILFFGLRSPGLALVEILLLGIAIGVTTFYFWRRSRRAGALMLPYLAWVGFAAVLNASIWRLNA